VAHYIPNLIWTSASFIWTGLEWRSAGQGRFV